jgi:hypothetical protein
VSQAWYPWGSGYDENAAINNGHLDDGMQMLTKPFTMSDLAGKVTALMN